jgi:hypothetical protein
MGWFDTNRQGKCDFRNIFDDPTQGPTTVNQALAESIIRLLLVLSGQLPNAVKATEVEVGTNDMICGRNYCVLSKGPKTPPKPEKLKECREKKWKWNDFIVGDNDRWYSINQSLINSDAEKLRNNQNVISILPQVYYTKDKTVCLLGLCGAARAWSSGDYYMTKEMEQLCNLALAPQYRILARMAKQIYLTKKDNNPVILNLCQVGIRSYHNAPSILKNALEGVFEEVAGTNILVALHGFNNEDTKIWWSTLEDEEFGTHLTCYDASSCREAHYDVPHNKSS